jgi:hypothetical protein
MKIEAEKQLGFEIMRGRSDLAKLLIFIKQLPSNDIFPEAILLSP